MFDDDFFFFFALADRSASARLTCLKRTRRSSRVPSANSRMVMHTPGSSCSTHSAASRSLALLTDTDASSSDDVVARDGSKCGGAGAGGGAELSRLKWCAHTWSEGSGTAVDAGLHVARAVGAAAAAAAIALHGVARAIGCSRPAAVGGRITTGLSLVEPARE